MSTRQHPLSLHRLTFVSTLNQDLVADYLAHLRTRHYSAKTLQTTLGALVTFYRLLPPARQPRLWEDVTRQTRSCRLGSCARPDSGLSSFKRNWRMFVWPYSPAAMPWMPPRVRPGLPCVLP